MRRIALVVWIALSFGSCGDAGGRAGVGGGGDGAGMAPVDGGGPEIGGAGDAAAVGDLALPPDSPSVAIGPIALASGQETTQCVTMRLPTTAPIDVVRIQADLALGSHHLIVYKSNATTESLTPTACSSFQGVLQGDQPIFIAQSLSTSLPLPTGVAYHFPAGQMFLVEAHYLNASMKPTTGMGRVWFAPGQSGMSYQAADIMFCGSVKQLGGPSSVFGCSPGVGLPPNSQTSLAPGFYSGGSGVDLTTLKIFAFTGHEHHYGKEVKIWKATGPLSPNPQAPLYDSTTWDNAPLTTFDDNHLLTFNAGEGLEWQCSYDTTGATSNVCFGESAQTNEMCFLWAYYFPSVGRFIQRNDCWQ